MGMAENTYMDFKEITEITEEEKDAFDKVKNLAEKIGVEKNLHVGLKDELDRHKQVMETIKELDRKVDMIIKHFNIVQIVGD